MSKQKTTALELPLTPGRYLLRNGKVAIIKKNNRQRDKAKWPWRGRILDKEYISQLDFDVWNVYGEHSETETLYCEEVSQYDIVARLPDFPLPPRAPDKPQSTSSETLTGNMQVGGDHYKKMKHQPIDVMESCMSPEELKGFLRGNALKYLMRMGHKDSAHTDVYKALHYVDMLVKLMDKQKGADHE
jgi:hypothetical protein